jgi:adenylate kinase family enzyme
MTPTTKATRIHIVGSAGSGKTTLAKELGASLALPCHDLDEVAYEGGFGRKIALDDRVASLQQIITQPGWVTEGAFIWWTAPLMEAADMIVWLDLPVHITGWRIVARHFRLSWAGTNRHPGFVKLLRFLTFVTSKQLMKTAITPKSADDDAATTRVATAEFLRAYAPKVVHCRTPAEVAAFKQQLCAHHP